jgi:hypothetical protein
MNTEAELQDHVDVDGASEQRISLGDPQQVQDWATKLGVSAEHLRELVAQVGPRMRDLRQRLCQPEVND